MVERGPEKAGVGGSIPSLGTSNRIDVRLNVNPHFRNFEIEPRMSSAADPSPSRSSKGVSILRIPPPAAFVEVFPRLEGIVAPDGD